MESSYIFLVLSALVLILAHNSDAIKCYQCNSGWKYEGEACADPIDTTAIETVDCQEAHGIKDGRNYTRCRKIGQTVDGEYRIVRTCASYLDKSLRCMDRTGTKDVKVRYCECEGDACNSAPAVFPSFLTAVVLAVTLLVPVALRT